MLATQVSGFRSIDNIHGCQVVPVDQRRDRHFQVQDPFMIAQPCMVDDANGCV